MSKPLPKLTTRQRVNFERKIKVVGDCWEWQGSKSKGYGHVKLNGKTYKAHRIAYFIATGHDPGGKLACHSCDNRRCCRPDHVFPGTTADNAQDAATKGRLSRTHQLKGSSNPNAKLTEAIARIIKLSDEPNVILAKRYGISDMIVSLIKRGERWAHIDRVPTVRA